MGSNLIGKGRIEAFSDGVIAIIVTIMVLELRVPAEPTLQALTRQAPVFLCYFLSFLVVAVMWVNHHHMMAAVREVNPRLLWLNMNLLFWMSLIPFVTTWMGRHATDVVPVSLYGVVLAQCGAAFSLLRVEIIRQESGRPLLARYHTRLLWKSGGSCTMYLCAAAAAHVSVYAAEAVFVIIPLLYFLPEHPEPKD